MEFNNFPYRRGEIYVADLGEDTVGSVQRGERPVIVIQNDVGNQEGPTLIVIPLTTQVKKEWLPVHVILPETDGLEEISMALCEQLITIDKRQIKAFLTTLDDRSIAKVQFATLISLGLVPVEKRRLISYCEGPDDMVLTLCAEHKQPYLDSREYRVRRLDHFQNKERCTLCGRMGYDYKITHIQREKGDK